MLSLMFTVKCVIFMICFFFFSSRRRHTRFDCDWSSDVCSSDLHLADRRLEIGAQAGGVEGLFQNKIGDRKSTRLNSSHSQISYAVFCLKKKKTALAHRSPRVDAQL